LFRDRAEIFDSDPAGETYRLTHPMSAPARAGTGGSTPLPLGTVVGGRFRIQSFVRSEAGTDLYRAIDSQGGAAVLLRVLSEAPAARAVLDADLAKAARLQHKNLTHLVAVGDYAGMLFLAAEAEDGHTLRELVEAQRSQGKTIGLSYARTLLGHVTHGLEAAYQAMPHGGLHPERIWVTKGGRVKVSDLGLTRGLPALARKGGPAGAPEGLYLAPEVARALAPNAASDVYSLGAILYELITGTPPAPPLRAASQAAADVPAAVDAVIARAMAPQPHARFATPVELMNALATAAEPPAARHTPHTPSATANGAAPTPGPGRITLGKSFDVAQAAGLAENDERWLIQKDKLDYGPFSLAQVMAQIERGVFKADHMIVDVESGERKKIKEHPLLGEFALDADRKLEKQRRAQAEVAHEHVERKKGRATRMILGIAIIAVAVGVGGYIYTRSGAQDDVLTMRISDDDLDAFIKTAKFDFAKKKPATRRGGKADDFSNNMNLGDVSQGGGGDDILSDNQVQSTMMANYRKLIPCLMTERRHNPGLTDVDMDIAIAGSGKVKAVRVNGQSGNPFAQCIYGKMQSFSFPSFNGKKTLASWSFSAR
jgi:serine/threonine-protein kinase